MFPNAADGEEFSESDADEGFDEDLEALRRACILTGNDPDALQPSSSSAFAPDRTTDSDSEEDDLELIRGIQQRFAACTDMETPLFLKPLSTLPPASLDDDEDDFETLRAIQRRFSGYDKDILKSSKENHPNKLEHVTATKMALEKDASNNLVAQRNKLSEGFPDMSDFCNTSQNLESLNDNILKVLPSDLIEWHQPDTHSFSNFSTTDTGFPKSAQMFVDAIKKNRACQKFLRSKLMQIEARIEENKKLKKRVKVLKDFQVTCKTRTGRSLSQKKDARVQLISSIKPRANSKVKRKKFSSLYYGPDENPHVANYRMVLAKFPISLNREKWTEAERENLAKGIKQQFQELLLQKSVDLISDMEGSSGDFNDVDSIVASIRDVDITPENIRSFLPKVNWKRLAAMYVTSRSGAECEARWLNYEDPLICQNPWTNMEDKKLLHIIQQRGINNWIDISVLLGTNRTPFQCLARYQRSLNASILKREWTEDEDEKLRAAVEAFGESNWQPVASALEGRTGTQCSNRWIKSLNPARKRIGKWTLDEDKRLKVAVMIFGHKTWKKIAHFVPGRTHVQCRERWFNVLDPSLIFGEWTEEEDSRLEEAISVHGYCWYKVAACVPPRTDSQCRRRWKALRPSEVPLLQAAKKIQKAALISNFVDRESERPALGPNDFIPLALMSTVTESENINHSREQKRRSRRRSRSKGNGKGCSSNWQIEAPVCSTEVPLLTNGTEAQNFGDNGATSKKKKVAKKRSEPNVVENGKKVRPSDGGTKTKKSFGRQKRKSTGKPEATEIDTASSDELISKKQRAMKPRSKKNRGSDTTKAHSSTSADLELLIRRTSEEEGGEHCAAAAAKNRKASKRGKRKSSCVKLRDEFLGMINSDEGINNISKTNKQLYLSQLKQDKHMDSTQVDSSACLASTVRITNVDEDEAFCDDGARKKTYRKLHSRSKYSRLQQELSEITDSSEFETLGGNDAILKKKMMTKESLNGCNSLNNLATSNSFYASEAACENHATKKRKASKPCSRSISSDSPWHSKSLETSDRDNTTLHTMKRAHNVNPTRKSPKRLVQHQNNSLSSVEVANLQAKQTETAKLEERSRIISSPEKCLTYDLSANGDLIAPGICKLETIKRSMKRRKTHSVQVLEAEDGDDMTLAFFIKSIVQRRRLRFAKESSNASSPDYMKGSELFHKENCCNDKRNNVLPSQAM